MKFCIGIGFLILSVFFTLGETVALQSSQQTCGANEEYLSCGPSCQTECPTLNQPCLINHIRCPDGCYCKNNFARQTIGGRCIPINQCSSYKSHK